MSVASFIRRCVENGMPLEMALKAGEAFEIEAPLFVPPKSKGAERTARYRERKASQSSQNVTGDACDKRKSPEPPKKTTPIPPLKGGTFPTDEASQHLEKPEQKPIGDWVAEIWESTPTEGHRRSSRREVETSLKAAIRRGRDPARILAGLIGYYETNDATKQDRKYARGVHVMIENDRWETFEPSAPGPPDDPDPWPRRLLGWETNGYWNSEWGPKPSKGQTEARAA